jgi:hypothetical protein
MSLEDILKMEVKPIPWFIDEILREGGFSYLYGPPGSGKTTSAMYMALMASFGLPIFGKFNVPKPLNVCWIDEEIRKNGCIYLSHILMNGILKQHTTVKRTTRFDFYWENHFDIIKDVEVIEELFKKHNYDVIYIDSLTKVFNSDEKDKTSVKQIYSTLQPFLSQNKSFTILHHSRKAQFNMGRSLNELSGSHELSAHCDDLLYMEKICSTEGYDRFKLSSQKPRFHTGFKPFNIDFRGDNKSYLTLTYSGLVEENALAYKTEKLSDAKTAIYVYLREKPKKDNIYATSEIIQAMEKKGIKEDLVRDALYRHPKDNLVIDGIVQREGKYGKIKLLKDLSKDEEIEVNLDGAD